MPSLLPAAARVVDEDAVAVADEHLGVAQGAAAVAAAARDHEHGGAVLGRAVPALEVDAVGGGEADVLVVGARRAADRAGHRVDVHDRHPDRAEEEDHGDAGTPAARARGWPSAAPGPRLPSPRWRKGIQAARPTSTTPATSASTPVTSLAVRPVPRSRKWWTWRPPFTAASTPNVKATAARTPGRSESNRATASTVATSAMPKASACWVSGTPPPGKRKASSNACSERRPRGDAEHLRLGRARADGARRRG